MSDRPAIPYPRAAADGPSPPFGSEHDDQAAQDLAAQRRRDHVHTPVGILPAIQSLIYLMIVAMFLFAFTVQPIRIPSSSMEPTLLVGDFLLLDRQAVSSTDGPWLPPAGVQRGDIVVFHDPVEDSSVHIVKRVIGVPGDRIHLHGNLVFVNGRPLQEPYAVYRPSQPDSFRDDFPSLAAMDARVDPAWWIRLRRLVQSGDLVVPPGNFFVLGDNRNESDDSRYWGFVPRAYIVGKPVLVYFSWRDPATPTGAKDFARWNRIFHVVR